MTEGEIMYLAMVCVAAVAFMVTLFVQSRRDPRGR